MNNSLTADDIINLIQSKTFQSTDQGFTYQFIPVNTLQVNGNKAMRANYQIEKVDGQFLLNHNSLLGSNPLVLELIKETGPIEFAVTEKNSNKFWGTWKELTY